MVLRNKHVLFGTKVIASFLRTMVVLQGMAKPSESANKPGLEKRTGKFSKTCKALIQRLCCTEPERNCLFPSMFEAWVLRTFLATHSCCWSVIWSIFLISARCARKQTWKSMSPRQSFKWSNIHYITGFLLPTQTPFFHHPSIQHSTGWNCGNRLGQCLTAIPGDRYFINSPHVHTRWQSSSGGCPGAAFIWQLCAGITIGSVIQSYNQRIHPAGICRYLDFSPTFRQSNQYH